MSSIPKVTIIIATYNRAPFILEMLQSIHKQTFLDWEALIIDDGCTDNTLEVISPILQQEERFHYYSRIKSYTKGTSGCRNYGLDIAKGDYIIFFDDDDVAHPQNLELCVIELSKDEISFCRYIRTSFFGDFDYSFDYSKEYVSFYIDVNDIEKVLKYELPFNSCAVMWKKKCFKNSRFNEDISYADEWELYTRILSQGIKGISIEKCLFYGRKHTDSITGEFIRNNLNRKTSYYKAILLVLGNLKEKKLLSYSLIRHFIIMSLGFKEYNLFSKIIIILDLSQYKKLKWQLFYVLLPLRLTVYKLKKRIIKK
ncbi:glycosyltransferase family 2 protein [Flavobacterium sp. GSP6]|uniref:glycosyltransferase family 2 protein n=1 Tax=Flavobacterium sp. GSP6 TaxID=2497488 RepID=UPI000F881A72|nr:glycosyltransferase family 2 protein [Flavobacterium sp. GSP6]RTZ08646.1 glycosyltransferase family 2 protein [Flavobacterium sp. GSP6]